MRGTKARKLRRESGLYQISRDGRHKYFEKIVKKLKDKKGNIINRIQIFNECKERLVYRRFKRGV